MLSDRVGYGLIVYGIFILVTTGTLPTGLLQDYAEAFGFSPAVLSLVAASTTFGVTIAVFAFGNLSDRIGRRPVLIPGVAAGAGCLVLYFLVQGSVLFVGARMLSGFAVGLFTGAGTALLTELAPSGQSRRAATHAATASVAGFAIGPVIGGAFAEYLPWPRHLVYGVALVLLLPALLGAVLVRETVADRGRLALRLQRLRMPPERKAFGLAAALAVCAWMSASFFGALGAVMAIRLFDIENRFVATLVVLCFLGSSAVAQMGLRGQPIRRSALAGSAFLIAGFALIVAGLAHRPLRLLRRRGARRRHRPGALVPRGPVDRRAHRADREPGRGVLDLPDRRLLRWRHDGDRARDRRPADRPRGGGGRLRRDPLHADPRHGAALVAVPPARARGLRRASAQPATSGRPGAAT